LQTQTTCSTGLAILFLAVALIAGCKTTPTVDWKSRVGTYTYNQALAELVHRTSRPNTTTARPWINGLRSTAANGFSMAEVLTATITEWAQASPSRKATRTTFWN